MDSDNLNYKIFFAGVYLHAHLGTDRNASKSTDEDKRDSVAKKAFEWADSMCKEADVVNKRDREKYREAYERRDRERKKNRK